MCVCAVESVGAPARCECACPRLSPFYSSVCARDDNVSNAPSHTHKQAKHDLTNALETESAVGLCKEHIEGAAVEEEVRKALQEAEI